MKKLLFLILLGVVFELGVKAHTITLTANGKLDNVEFKNTSGVDLNFHLTSDGLYPASLIITKQWFSLHQVYYTTLGVWKDEIVLDNISVTSGQSDYSLGLFYSTFNMQNNADMTFYVTYSFTGSIACGRGCREPYNSLPHTTSNKVLTHSIAPIRISDIGFFNEKKLNCYNTISTSLIDRLVFQYNGQIDTKTAYEISLDNVNWENVSYLDLTDGIEIQRVLTQKLYCRLKLYDSWSSAVSNALIYNVAPPFVAGTISTNSINVCTNQSISFNGISSSGADPIGIRVYQWMHSEDNGISWINDGGAGDFVSKDYAASSNTFLVNNGTTNKTILFKRLDTQASCGDTGFTNTIAVTIYPALSTTNTITPSTQDICFPNKGADIVDAVPVTGGSGNYSYTWMYKRAIVDPFIPMTDLTTQSYPAPNPGKLLIVQKITTDNAGCGSVTSNNAVVNVAWYLGGGTSNTTQKFVCQGQTSGVLTIDNPSTGGMAGLHGSAYAYQWQVNFNGDINNQNQWFNCGSSQGTYSSPTGAQYETTPLTSAITTNYHFYLRRATIDPSGCGTAYSNIIDVVVYPQFSPGTIVSANPFIYSGHTINAISNSTAPSGGNITSSYYQWKVGTTINTANGLISIDGTSNSNPFYNLGTTPLALTATRQFIGAGGCLTPNITPSIPITVYPILTGGAITSTDIIVGAAANIPTLANVSLPAGGDGKNLNTFIWQISSDKTLATTSDIVGSGGVSYTPANNTVAISTTKYFRRKAWDNSNTTDFAYSNWIKVTRNSTLLAGSIGEYGKPLIDSICKGTNYTVASTSMPSAGVAPYTFSWTYTDAFGVEKHYLVKDANGNYIEYNNANLPWGALQYSSTFTRITKDASGQTAACNVRINVGGTLNTGTITVPANICQGSTITVEGTSYQNAVAPLGYRWFINGNPVAEYNQTGRTLSFTVPSIPASKNYSFVRTIVDRCNNNLTIANTQATSTVTSLAGGPLTSGNLSFNSAALCFDNNGAMITSGGSGDLSGGYNAPNTQATYIWKKCVTDSPVATDWVDFNNVGVGSNLSTATTLTMSNVPTSIFVKRIGTNACGSATTPAIAVNVAPELVPGVIKYGSSVSNPNNELSICYDSPLKFDIIGDAIVGNGVITYKWFKNDTEMQGINSQDLRPSQVGNLTTTSTFYRKVYDAKCNSIGLSSNAITITVGTQPFVGTLQYSGNTTLCYGEKPNQITIDQVASGGLNISSYTYKWYKKELNDVDFLLMSNETTGNLQAQNLTTTTTFKRTVSGGVCFSETANNVVMFEVKPELVKPVISCNNATVNFNDKAMFTINSTATGGKQNGTYHWESSTTGTNFLPYSGTSTLSTFTTNSLIESSWFKMVYVGDCKKISSDSIFITVNNIVSAPIIEVPTQKINICYNTAPDAIVMTTDILGGDNNLTKSYQWLTATTDTSRIGSWSVVGGNGTTLSDARLLKVETYYKLKATKGTYVRYSNAITIHVMNNLDGDGGSIVFDDPKTIYNGQKISLIKNSLACTRTDFDGSYSWQLSANGTTFSDITTQVDATPSMQYLKSLTSKTYFRRLASTVCGLASTAPITAYVYDVLDSGAIGSNQLIQYGTVPQLLTSAREVSGGNSTLYHYQWQQKVDNGIWTNVFANGNSSTYQPTLLNVNTSFKRVISDGYSTKESNVITITMGDHILTGTIGKDTTICNNGYAILNTITNAPVINSLNWQDSIVGRNFKNIVGATSGFFITPALTQTTYYRKQIGGATGFIYTNIVTVTVNPPFNAGVIGSDTTVCYGVIPPRLNSVTAANGVGNSYGWLKQEIGGAWNNIGVNSPTYQTLALTTTTQYKRLASNVCGSGESNIVKISVREPFVGGNIQGDQEIIMGTTASILNGALPTGGDGGYTFQWQALNGLKYQNILDATQKDLPATTFNSTSFLRRKAYSKTCGNDSSNVVKITTFDKINAGQINSTESSICNLVIPKVLSGSVALGGNSAKGYTYKWQKSTDVGLTWSSAGVNNSGVFFQSADALTSSTYYRRGAYNLNDSSFTAPILITVMPQIELAQVVTKPAYCVNSSFTLKAKGTNAIGYKWYDANKSFLESTQTISVDTIKEDTQLFVKVLAENGCYSDYQTVNLVTDKVKANFNFDLNKIEVGNAVHFTNTSENAIGYTWNFFDGDLITEIDPIHYYNYAGKKRGESKEFDVKLLAKSVNNCVDSILVPKAVFVMPPVSLFTLKSETLKVYPNPVVNILNIDTDTEPVTVEIYNAIGGLLLTDSEPKTVFAIDMREYNSGIYFVRLSDNFGNSQTIKINK